VEVRLVNEPNQLRVEVSDNGPGISKSDQPIIFERFRQGRDTLTDKAEGTGLGLAISRQIIAHFGGRLWVESELDCGATFAFVLPVTARIETADARAIAAPA
jgi:signal transduction histidine kinase